MKAPEFLGPDYLKNDPVPPGRRRITEEEWRVTRIKTAVILSVLMYGMLMFMTFTETKNEIAHLFDLYPQLGIPPLVFSWLFVTILYIPVPFFMWHAMKVFFMAIRDGRGIGQISLFLYLVVVHEEHPSLRRSQLVVFGSFAYLFAVIILWASIKPTYAL